VTEDEVRALVDEPARRAEISAVELAELFLERLESAQPRLHAMITLTPELALEGARRADDTRAAGERLPLDGLPLVLKDNIDVAGVRTTVGSRLFEGRVATQDAEVTMRLRAAGAVILGKANLHELAFGATSRNETFGQVVNPAAPDRIPGGSSGGSGAAVAADLCIAAIGTDTGGSVRLPASLCGVSGLRPTYGAVSNRGVQPVSSSLDTVGPLARSVASLRAVLAAMSGHDPGDPGSLADTLELTRRPVSGGLRVGVVESLVERSDRDVAVCVREACEAVRGLGASLVCVELEGWERAVEACGRLIKSEALAVYLDALESDSDLLEAGTRRRLRIAADVAPSELEALRRERTRWTSEVEETLGAVDVLLLPTIPVQAPLAEGADTVETTAEVVPYTHLLSFAHAPSLSVPCGVDRAGAPVGVQLAAARRRDGLLLDVGEAVQAVTGWHRRRPEAGSYAGSTRTTS
jgi:aspartyl-tRNA(Asn)/glutamyl-tRNA(Gln) amidotransferase subunit A